MRFALLLKRVVAEKALPFEPLVPNAETIAAMKAARRGALVTAGKPASLLASLNATIRYTTRFKRDYWREKAGQLGKRLDGLVVSQFEISRPGGGAG